MTIFHGIILGVIEGLTEFLPISSTAHLILASDWLRLPTTEFLKTFEISIQLGAILAVVILYWKKIWSGWNLIFKIAAAFIPTAIIGLIFYKVVKNYLMDNNYIIAGALLVGGLILIIFEKYYSQKITSSTPENPLATNNDKINISYGQALIIGVFQALAIIPGVSRAAATIIGGLSLGINRKNIVEFSFLLAIPTMIAATGLDLYKSRAVLIGLGSQELLIWLAGFAAALITAIIGVKFFIKFIQKNNFAPFGWYRIGLGLIVLIWLFL
ncbi:MAG: undecaprenyl-diphosphate phosphatase [Patescibacteria group bacterium]|jgi:undecaprenyl-diphosphatase